MLVYIELFVHIELVSIMFRFILYELYVCLFFNTFSYQKHLTEHSLTQPSRVSYAPGTCSL